VGYDRNKIPKNAGREKKSIERRRRKKKTSHCHTLGEGEGKVCGRRGTLANVG
jgi:hypothetical protein